MTNKQMTKLVSKVSVGGPGIVSVSWQTFPKSPGGIICAKIAALGVESTGAAVIRNERVVPGPVLTEMDRSSALREIRAVCIELVLHELDEQFRFNGRRPFDPHRQLPHTKG